MSVKKATLVFFAAIAVLIAIVWFRRGTEPSEHFISTGYLVLIFYSIPLMLLTASFVNAAARFTVKKASLILVAACVSIPFTRAILPPEYLLDVGLKAALYKLATITLGIPVVIIPLLIFFNSLLGTGRDKKPKDLQGFFDLRIKTGPRWMAAVYGGAGVVLVAYMLTFIRFDLVAKVATSRSIDVSVGSAALLLFLLAMVGVLLWTIWAAILSAVLRVRYDEERIIVTTMIFTTREHKWADLMKVKDMSSSDGKRLIFRDTGTVRIEEYLEGFDDLMKHANGFIADA